MDDVVEMVEDAAEESDGGSRLNSVIALLVAVAATLMALGNIKDNNIVQGMDKAQARMVNAWGYFQSKSTKQHLADGRAQAIELQLAATPNIDPDARKVLETKLAEERADVQRYEKEKEEIKKEAEGHQLRYDELGKVDDQFDISEACLSVAIALFGVTALTRKTWLMWFASMLGLVGTAMALAGFFGWGLRIEWLAKSLS
jgi:hypothetical protein